jgi:hypothetical protein
VDSGPVLIIVITPDVRPVLLTVDTVPLQLPSVKLVIKRCFSAFEEKIHKGVPEKCGLILDACPLDQSKGKTPYKHVS